MPCVWFVCFSRLQYISRCHRRHSFEVIFSRCVCNDRSYVGSPTSVFAVECGLEGPFTCPSVYPLCSLGTLCTLGAHIKRLFSVALYSLGINTAVTLKISICAKLVTHDFGNLCLICVHTSSINSSANTQLSYATGKGGFQSDLLHLSITNG